MAKFDIVPKITVYKGCVVNSSIGTESCAEAARQLYLDGADAILLHNADYTSAGAAAMCAAVAETVNKVFVPVKVSGAIFETAQIRILISEGADRVFYNSAAVYNSWRIEESVSRLGARYIGVAINCRQISGTVNREVLLNNGETPSGKDAYLWAVESRRLGASELLLCAKAEKSAFDKYAVQQIIPALDIPVMLAGDFFDADVFADAARSGASAVVSGVFCSGDFNIGQIKRQLAGMGVDVRL